MKNQYHEIERKWLLEFSNSSDEDCSRYFERMSRLARESKLLSQGYVKQNNSEKYLRIRQFGDDSFIAYKESIPGRTSIVRNEWEQKIPQFVFDALWTETEGMRIEKTRLFVDVNSKTFEIDFFHGRNEGIVIVECEFNSIEEAENFKLLPQELRPIHGSVQDVTFNDRYTNQNMSK